MSVYILRRYEGGGVRLFVGGITRIEIAVLGGHVIVGLSKKRNSTTWSGHVVQYPDGGVCPCSCMYVFVRRARANILFSSSMQL